MKVYRTTRTWLEGESTICFAQRIIAEARAGKLYLADGDGVLRPATRKEILATRNLTERECADLLAAKKRNLRREDREADEARFTIAVPLPAISTFRSRGLLSPLRRFMKWAGVQKMDEPEMYPDDILIHRSDAAELLRELEDWHRIVHGRRGDALRRAVGLHDLGAGPLETSRGSSLPRGWVFLRPDARDRA